jgi:signal transduction histidine kinase
MAGAERRRSGLWGAGARLPAPWLGHVILFGFLIGLTSAAFFLQTRAAEHRFVAAAAEHSRLLADAVGLYARGALLAGAATDTILTAFLGNTARFVLYLDAIEPFSADELSAFAAESGLAMIAINRAEAPQAAWVWGAAALALPNPALDCAPSGQLRPWPDASGFVLSVPRDGPGCALVALRSAAVHELRAAVSVTQALHSIRTLPGVLAVQLEGEPRPALSPAQSPEPPPRIRVIETRAGSPQAEVRAGISGAELVLRLDGRALAQRRQELWLAFGGFLLALISAGALGTGLLVRVQRAHERELRDYEQRLSAQREDAGLGRAAATIAHEIRNPLNAIGLGLQRLQLEACDLQPGQQRLIAQVRQALTRTNATVGTLLDYARPGQRERQPVDVARLLREALDWQRALLDERAACLQVEQPASAWVLGDAEQLRRVLDNLLTNAREALPAGGRLEMTLARQGDNWQFSLTNDGLAPLEQPLEELLEPWVTHKTAGTGLGLAIVRRILQAHEGRIALDSPVPGRLRVRLWLAVLSETEIASITLCPPKKDFRW